MKATEVKIEIMKNKLMANFSHYISGNLYYNVLLGSGLYQFPIPTVEFDEKEDNIIGFSSDLGTTRFDAHIKASLLNRWIGKAIEKGEFIKID